jgi:hypothetical protein
MRVFCKLAFIVLGIWVNGCGQSSLAQTVVPPRKDKQLWNELQIAKPINKRQDLVFMGVVRIGRHWQRPVDERIGVGWAFKLNQYLTVMPTYIHVEYQPFPTRFIHEERLILNVTVKFTARQFTFTDRNLIERRVWHNEPDFTVYRNRLQIDHPMRLGKMEFKGYIADEVWHSTQSRNGQEFGWLRNRISIGIIKQLKERLTGDFFLLYQSDGKVRPGNIPVVGMIFRHTL